jgi:hypothetical protein
MPSPRLRELLSASAAWLQRKRKRLEPIHPPEWTVRAVEARGQWSGIRRLDGVVEVPVLRPDGSVLEQPGYDAQTCLLYEPQAEFPPVHIDADTVASARDDLLEIVCDFPFATDAHRSAWLAALFTMFARYAFHGPAPLFGIDANVRGSGKSLLTDAICIVATGRDFARMTAPKDDEEARKRITAIAIAGEPMVLIDNIGGALGSASLDAALTATAWTDRRLGASEMVCNIPLNTVWFATGNNLMLQADTARRTLHIRIETPEENPEERQGFRHPDLLAWLKAQRPRLAVAAVTLLHAYCRGGRPDQGLTPWGSFGDWSRLVRHAVVWCGLPDPGDTRTELRTQADRDATTLRQLIAGWEEVDPGGSGMTVATAIKRLNENQDRYDRLRSAFEELAPAGKAFNSKSIGMKLHHLRRRVVGGKRFDKRISGEWFVQTD